VGEREEPSLGLPWGREGEERASEGERGAGGGRASHALDSRRRERAVTCVGAVRERERLREREIVERRKP
jgi:hypothetical protein